MNTLLDSWKDNVRVLRIQKILPHDFDIFAAWLLAFGMSQDEIDCSLSDLCKYGSFAFSNISHRISIYCTN